MTRAAPAGASVARAGAGHDAVARETALVLLLQMKRSARLWGALRLVVGRFALRRVPGLAFFKVLGSGHEGGFGLRPSADRLGLFALFADEAAADRFVAASPVMQAWAAHARECAWLKLACCSARGAWAGRALVVRGEPPADGPIAVLTRASIRPRSAFAFWRLSPAAEHALIDTPGCRLATGLGEAPLLRQATFSVWRDAASVEAYARHGPHLAAARAAYQHGWFAESLFARFVVLDQGGRWKGRDLG
ncbi:MAG TPA: spheroidene monooxygenase [Methylibium sp.]|nr:spheroidene monooxygenase [Methylibium sp.]